MDRCRAFLAEPPFAGKVIVLAFRQNAGQDEGHRVFGVEEIFHVPLRVVFRRVQQQRLFRLERIVYGTRPDAGWRERETVLLAAPDRSAPARGSFQAFRMRD